jgi:hypothetical protein
LQQWNTGKYFFYKVNLNNNNDPMLIIYKKKGLSLFWWPLQSSKEASSR